VMDRRRPSEAEFGQRNRTAISSTRVGILCRRSAQCIQ
jgi:hypothetical protein